MVRRLPPHWWILLPISTAASAGPCGGIPAVFTVLPTAFAFTSSVHRRRKASYDGKNNFNLDDLSLENRPSNCPSRTTTVISFAADAASSNWPGTVRLERKDDDENRFSVSRALESVKVGDLLGDLPTPTLLLELSLAERALNQTNIFDSLDDVLNAERATVTNDDTTSLLDGSLFVHTRVCDTSDRDAIDAKLGSGKSPSIGRVDVGFVPGGAFLGIGVSNHHVGGYYWARGMGMGAALEAHGVGFRGLSASQDPYNGMGELYWRKRKNRSPTSNDEFCNESIKEGATTETSSNSNDGKRSEWADFLSKGDTIQLVPYNATSVLVDSGFQWILGIRREGRPLGADPIVEKIWKRETLVDYEIDDRGYLGLWIPIA